MAAGVIAWVAFRRHADGPHPPAPLEPPQQRPEGVAVEPIMGGMPRREDRTPEIPLPPIPPDTPAPVVETVRLWARVLRTNDQRFGAEQVMRRMSQHGASAVPALMSVAERAEDPRMRAQAISMLALERRPELADFYRGRLADEHEFVRESALIALAGLGAWEEVEARAQSDPSERVRRKCALLLARRTGG
jgi:hypothetical protein